MLFAGLSSYCRRHYRGRVIGTNCQTAAMHIPLPSRVIFDRLPMSELSPLSTC